MPSTGSCDILRAASARVIFSPARFLIIVSAKPRSSAASAIPSIMSTVPPDKWNITTPMHP